MIHSLHMALKSQNDFFKLNLSKIHLLCEFPCYLFNHSWKTNLLENRRVFAWITFFCKWELKWKWDHFPYHKLYNFCLFVKLLLRIQTSIFRFHFPSFVYSSNSQVLLAIRADLLRNFLRRFECHRKRQGFS